MIQILGLRNGDAFFEKGWSAPDIFELFQKAEHYLEQVPREERWNIFYTVANCTEEKRKFLSQDVLPLDIDGIEPGTEGQIVDVICQELRLPKDKLGIVYSGNGVHIIIGLRESFDAAYMRTNKPYYKALCGRVNTALFDAGLSGNCDTVVFSEARILRMPFTKNVKKDKGTKDCVLIGRNLERLDVDLFSLADLPQVAEGEHIHPTAFLRLPDPDTEAVLNGCGFIKHCGETDEKLPEPMWYAMLSIVGRLENGIEIAKQLSIPKGNKHDKYTHLGYHPHVERKVKHAVEAAGPRTCDNIAQMYEGCRECPHFGQIKSPITIRGAESMFTKKNGFYEIVTGKDGIPKRGKPNYDDLMVWFRKNHEYVTLEQTRQLYVWNGTHWEEMHQAQIHSFAEKNFKPSPSNSMCLEFESKLKRTNLKDDSFVHVDGYLNFKNGVINLETGRIEQHSSAFGFTYTIPYDYAPTGSTSAFQKFLSDVTLGDKELADLIAEYMGYCLSGTDPSLVQKCAILYGDGSNGKSVLLSLLRELVGRENSAAVSISSLKKDTNRYALLHKMFNASDEAPTDSFLDSSTFKAMVSGDYIDVRRLYQDLLSWKCTTKLIFNCNELPHMADFSHGMNRRLIIIPFMATFSHASGNLDPNILDKLLAEKSDIFRYCLEKFEAVKKRGYCFTQPSASSEELEDYKYMNDHVTRFVYSMCKVSETSRQVIDIDQVYNLFVLWCQDNHVKPMVYGSFSRRFGKVVAKRYPKIEKNRPRNNDGNRTIGYKHLVIEAVSPSVTSTF